MMRKPRWIWVVLAAFAYAESPVYLEPAPQSSDSTIQSRLGSEAQDAALGIGG